jgi:hypothetical protein
VEEIADNRFTIATDEPLVKVAWRVTALRASREPSASESGSRKDEFGKEEPQ